MTIYNGMQHDMHLSEIMEFDHVIFCNGNSIVFDNDDMPRPGRSLYAPSVSVMPDGSEFSGLDEWQLLSGYTGQYGYRGPVMHASEYVGGSLARDILTTAGYYVAVVVESETCDDYALYGECGVSSRTDHQCSDEPAGWAVAFIPADAYGARYFLTGGN